MAPTVTAEFHTRTLVFAKNSAVLTLWMDISGPLLSNSIPARMSYAMSHDHAALEEEGDWDDPQFSSKVIEILSEEFLF